MKQLGKEFTILCIACSLRILNEKTMLIFNGTLTIAAIMVHRSTVDPILVSEYTLTNTTIVQYVLVGDLSYIQGLCPLFIQKVTNFA